MSTSDWSGRTILVTDDVEINFTLIEAMVRRKNVKTIWAKNGQEAVDFCMSNPDIDLVLMDIRMPIMNGLEATRLIKQYNKNIPVIAQTAYASPEDREMCFNAGCNDFIAKQFQSKDLIAVIEKWLDYKRQNTNS